jgi:hypothetical protein
MTRGVSENLLTRLPARVARFPWADVDRRSRPAREIAADYWRLATDLGGIEALSTQQLALVERASFLLMRIRQHESAVIAGRDDSPIDNGTHSNYCNVLTGVLKALGLERRAKDIRGPGDLMNRYRALEQRP